MTGYLISLSQQLGFRRKLPTGIVFNHGQRNLQKMLLSFSVWSFSQIASKASSWYGQTNVSCNQFACLFDSNSRCSRQRAMRGYQRLLHWLFNGFWQGTYVDLLKKLSQIGVLGSILDVISDYLNERELFVCLNIISSQLLDVTSGLAQVSVVTPVVLCFSIYNLPVALNFSDPYLLAVVL